MATCKYCGNKFERTIDPKSDFCSRCFLKINECPKKLRFKVEINIDGDPNEFYEYLESFLNLTHYINLYDIQIYLPEDHQTSDLGLLYPDISKTLKGCDQCDNFLKKPANCFKPREKEEDIER